MQTLVESRIGTVPMAMFPWQCPHGHGPDPFLTCVVHMGSRNKSRPRLLPRTFVVLTSGAGGEASESSFLILKQPAVATKLEMEIFKLEMLKSEILKLEMFGLEMVR